MSSIFWYQTFVAVSRNFGGNVSLLDDVLSSHEHEILSTASLSENCMELDFETPRNFDVDLREIYFVLKLNCVKVRGFRTYNTKKFKKEPTEKSSEVAEWSHSRAE